MVKNIIDELVAFSNLLPLKSNTLVTQESGSGKILGLKPLIKGGGGGVGGEGGGGCYFLYVIVVMNQTVSKKILMFLAMFKFVFSVIALSKY